MKGVRLGSYEILDKLGEGGMGEVWRARDERLNRMVAVKILPSEVANDPTRRARFEQEARALGALNHPNIVAVYDVGQQDGRAYMVSELVDGEPLRDVVDRGPLPHRKMIDFAVQIAEGIAAAHALGIVHRDLKPENIMVTRNGRVKVLDFGLAKQSAFPGGDAAITMSMVLSQPGVVMGTVGYMSPEQVRGEPADHRSDIFSLGCVLYEMATGKRAFQGGSAVETMNAILKLDPPELHADPSTLAPAPGAIIRRCLEKRPEQRFQSAADLAFALAAIKGTTASGMQPAVGAPGKAAPPWLWPLVAALAAGALFAGGYFLRDRTARQEPPRFQRITFRKGLITGARFTPDGRNVVYAANWEGGAGRVYLAAPGNPESRDLELPAESRLLAVSSKEDVAFLEGPFGKDGTGTLARGSISGGKMRPWLEGVRDADWAPDASSMAVLRTVDRKFQLEYPIGKVLLDKLEFPLFGIRVSPDGELIAYASYYQGSSIGLWVVDRAGKKQFLGTISGQTTVVTDPSLCWAANGREIWFRSFDLREWGTIYGVDLKGKQRVVARLPSFVTPYDIARDGRMLLSTDVGQVGILGVAPGETVERDLSCLDASVLNGISEDGSVITAHIVGESGGPKGSVYLRKTDGSTAIRLGDGIGFALSPDGKWVSGYSSKDAVTRKYTLLPTGAGEEREITIPGLSGQGIVFGWLPDQSYLVFGSLPGKRYQCFAWNASRGTFRPVCPEGIADFLPLVSPDRQRVLTRGPDGRWTSYSVADGEAKAVDGLSAHDTPVAWRSDNRSLFVTTHRDTNKTLPVAVLDLASGQKSPWKEIRPARPVDEVSNVRITPDGRAYAYNFSLRMSDLYVAERVK